MYRTRCLDILNNMKPFLTVVIPSYNEKENLKRGVLSDVRSFMQKKKFVWEVLVSDDGSTDGSKKLVEEQIKDWKNFKLLKNPHGGKPSTLHYGIKAAKGKFVLFADMDQSTPINQLDKLLPHLKKEYDAVIGSRGMDRKNFPIYRRLGSMVFMGIRKSLILSEINDTQCGFKVFKTRTVKKAFPKLEFFREKKEVKGWSVTSYDVELLHIIKKMGGNIKEVVVDWHDEDVSESKGGSMQRYIKESKEMFGQILRVKRNDQKGFYN